ncbi:MAG: TonB family protein [Gammaproteobacteria bacterium]|nr:TonB family protein [Gammaproteobacteria bacterium]
MKQIVIVLIMGLLSFQAFASGDMILTGVGLYSDLRAKYFYGALYTDINSINPSEILSNDGQTRMEIRVVAEDISKRRFYKLMNEMVAISNSVKNIEYHAHDILNFTSLLDGKLEFGDQVVIDNGTGKTIVSINGVDVMVSEDKYFINVLLSGWIGRLPPTADFKVDLLSGNKSPHYQAYMQTTPLQSRVAVIESWNTPLSEARRKQQLEKEEEQRQIRLAELEKQKLLEKQEKMKNRQLAISEKKAQEQAYQKQLADIERRRKLEHEKRLARIKQENEERKLAAKKQQLAESRYFRQLIIQANKAVIYPKQAYDRGIEGFVKIKVSIDKQGNIKQLETLESSQESLLDKAALISAKRAEPFPAVPDLLELDEGLYDFVIPYRFVAK